MSDQRRIGFDALFLEQPMTGAGQYATQLFQRLIQREDLPAPALLTPSDVPEMVMRQTTGAIVSGPTPSLPTTKARKIWWEQIGLPAAVAKSGVDLVHIPYFSAPIVGARRLVCTVHDVIPLDLPAYRGSWSMRAYLQLLRRSIQRATLIITDSEYSRQRIEHHLGISADRIVVTPLGVDARFRPNAREDVKTLERYGIAKPYLLNIGGFDQRKNLSALIEAFAMTRPSLPSHLTLVIGGRPHTGNRRLYPDLMPLIRRHGLESAVTFTGFIDDDDLPSVYRQAEAFVFPSVYEGFGLDPLEAMASGVPVICSNRTSLPEVVGDAGLLIEPEARQIAQAMVRLMGDSSLREELAGRGGERARDFTWERTVDLTLSAYERAFEIAERAGR